MWDDNCSWPRRLLHVDSLTSYPWQPGNRYGNFTNPPYNAITYTWGRYQLKPKDQDYLSTEPLPVNGTTWSQHLPKIRPDHFTVDEFLHIIKTAARPCDGYAAVKFLWLDIACINQTPSSEEYYSEIGRQAKIFQGAMDVFVWLTSLNTSVMTRWSSEMKGLSSIEYRIHKEDFHTWVDRAYHIIREFTSDPWFTSLWTLQEAFLCPYAIILCRDGISNETTQWLQSNDIADDRGVRPGYLKEFIMSCHQLRLDIKWAEGMEGQHKKLRLLEVEVERVGFLDGVCMEYEWDFGMNIPELPSGFMGNPFTLLKASHGRTAYVAVDRVYGIMQVFNLRLGKSEPGSEQSGYSMEELEDQLGEAILKQHPISSQLMVQNISCPPNKAWRINSRISLPREAYSFWRHVAYCQDGSSEQPIDTSGRGAVLRTKRHGQTLIGSFTGYVTSVRLFVAVLGQELSHDTITVNLDERWHTELREACPILTHVKPGFDELEWLQRRFKTVEILLLGRIEPPKDGETERNFYSYVKFRNWGIGLLLASVEDSYSQYQRLGTVVWDLEALMYDSRVSGLQALPTVTNALEYFNGFGDGWLEVSDRLFG